MVAVELRPLAREDFVLLSGWLREPAIDWWWHDDPAPEALEERYGPSIDGIDLLSKASELRGLGLVARHVAAPSRPAIDSSAT